MRESWRGLRPRQPSRDRNLELIILLLKRLRTDGFERRTGTQEKQERNLLIDAWGSDTRVLKGAQSQNFELFRPCTKLPLNWRNSENGSLLRKKNTKEIIYNKQTRMVKDGEDKHGFQMKNLKNLGSTFEDTQTMTEHL